MQQTLESSSGMRSPLANFFDRSSLKLFVAIDIFAPTEESMTSRSVRRLYAIISVLAFSLLILANVQPVAAQTTGSATLRGTVKDPQGAILRDATVTLINERNKDERRAKSSDDGTYTFAAVAPGTYTVKVEATGFKTATQSNLNIETSSTQGL